MNESSIKAIQTCPFNFDITYVNLGNRISIYKGDSLYQVIKLKDQTTIVTLDDKMEILDFSKEFFCIFIQGEKIAFKNSKYEFKVLGVIFFF